MLENQNLAYENKQLNLLLKEYEQTLEGVMNKFRGVCVSGYHGWCRNANTDPHCLQHAATQHELTLHQYYTSLLQQLQTTHSTSSLHDSTTLSTLLQRLSTLIRAALRSTNGEDEDFDHPGFDMPSTAAEKPPNLSDVIADIQNISTTPHINGPRSAGTVNNKTKWLGDQGVSGGYSGKSMARLDWSIEREGEILRLEEENRILREMLGVSKDVDLDTLAVQPDTKPEDVPEVQPPSRKRSLEKLPEEQKQDVEDKETPEGYTIEEQTNAKPESEIQPEGIEQTTTKKVQLDLDDSALAEEEEELPTSPLMTATASLVRSLSTSPKAQFKSPKLSKYATYSGGTPRSPAISRSQSATPNGSQSPLSGSIPSPNASLSSIFPRQAKTEPTTATTTTVELEDEDVTHTIHKPNPVSSASSSADPESNGIVRNKIEIKKVTTPPVPGSPLGKTPPKTGISRDHAVESRMVLAGKEDQSHSKHGNSKPDDPKEDLKGKKSEKPNEKSNGKDQEDSDAVAAEGDEKPIYAQVAKEDGDGQ